MEQARDRDEAEKESSRIKYKQGFPEMDAWVDGCICGCSNRLPLLGSKNTIITINLRTARLSCL